MQMLMQACTLLMPNNIAGILKFKADSASYMLTDMISMNRATEHTMTLDRKDTYSILDHTLPRTKRSRDCTRSSWITRIGTHTGMLSVTLSTSFYDWYQGVTEGEARDEDRWSLGQCSDDNRRDNSDLSSVHCSLLLSLNS